MALVRQRVNPELENDILTGVITNTSYLSKIVKNYQPHYFSDYGRVIVGWVMDYWDVYHQAPGKNIQNIYNVEAEGLPHGLARNIATYLENLSNTYEDAKEFNVPYLLEQTRVYFRRKSYEYLYTKGRDLILAGQVEEAAKLHESFRDTIASTSQWENPLDQRVIAEHFSNLDDDIYGVLSFRGALGELIGPLERGWLVSFLGPMKRGKSFWLMETLFRMAASRKRVAYINLEMIGKGVREREYTRLTATGKSMDKVQFPIFDCYYNQCGECPVPKLRTNDMQLRMDDAERTLPKWGSNGLEDYRVCTACRDREDYREHYLPDVWYTWHTPKQTINSGLVRKTAKGFVKMFGDNIRQITYPAYSVRISDIRRDLNELQWTEGFVPDGVLVDYADIVQPDYETGSERQNLNQVWKGMKRSAGDMGALWVTASQTTREAIDKEVVGQKDVPEDIRKLAHVDALYGINQTESEKEDLITRISTVVHRHKNWSKRTVAVLHQLALGMPYLDSEWWG